MFLYGSFMRVKISSVFHRSVYCNVSLLKDAFTRSPSKFKRYKKQEDIADTTEDTAEIETADPSEFEYQILADRTFRVRDSGHNVLVIQPYIKWGRNKKTKTTPQLQLAEAVTLIKTLKNWRVVDEMTISLMNMEKTTVFGTGNLEKLQDRVLSDNTISAIFISIDLLKGVQRAFLEKHFNIPVFDRYSIVVQIFREHAVSREAKLQVKLAEIPYIRGSINYLQPGHQFTGSHGETYVEFQKNLLKEKEKRIKHEIQALRGHREVLRKKRRKLHIPVVAVVGYTNCGKTTLIKALTEDDNILPKDVLFATLDVTVHGGVLPSRMNVLYVDTIGFISDIPTSLIESFVATLEDALLADVLVHVRDASHPDAEAQYEIVQETLKGLNLDENLTSNIIEVANKIDIAGDSDWENWTDAIPTSAVKLKGIDELKEAIELAVLSSTGRKRLDIRVRTSGEEYLWLHQETTVVAVRADPDDAQFSFLSVIISPHVLAKFTHHFINSNR